MTDQGRQRRERSCGSWSSQMRRRRAASRTQVDPERVLNESRPCLDRKHHQYIARGGSLSPGEDNYSSYRRLRGCACPRECEAIEHQYDTVWACDALQAVSIARQTQPNAIVLDMGLPAGNGFIVMERLETNAQLCGIPVIISSQRIVCHEVPRCDQCLHGC